MVRAGVVILCRWPPIMGIYYLDAPVKRVNMGGALVAYSPPLEDARSRMWGGSARPFARLWLLDRSDRRLGNDFC